jgi:hypothetical protein
MCVVSSLRCRRRFFLSPPWEFISPPAPRLGGALTGATFRFVLHSSSVAYPSSGTSRKCEQRKPLEFDRTGVYTVCHCSSALSTYRHTSAWVNVPLSFIHSFCPPPFLSLSPSLPLSLSLSFSQYHCRKCGRAVCSKCSDKESTYPPMGYEIPIRMCSDCHTEITTDEWVSNSVSH